MPGRFDQAFLNASPRTARPPTPLASLLIHGGVLLLWLVLLARALGGTGLVAWSTGVAYVGYDTALLAFVAWQTLPLLRAQTPPAAPDAARPSLGVIVAAHNEAGILPRTLACSLRTDRPRPTRIVIADDGSL